MSRESEHDLTRYFDAINRKHFDGFLDAPRLRWNSRLRTSAGRFIPGRRVRRKKGLLSFLNETLNASATPAVIEIASYLLEEKKARELIEDTIAHEMIHYWLWVRRRPYGHTDEFLEKMKEMGVSRYNSVPRSRPYRYIYLCMNCEKEFPSKRILGTLACANCCKKFSGGKFNSKFLLKLHRELSKSEGLKLIQEKARSSSTSACEV